MVGICIGLEGVSTTERNAHVTLLTAYAVANNLGHEVTATGICVGVEGVAHSTFLVNYATLWGLPWEEDEDCC